MTSQALPVARTPMVPDDRDAVLITSRPRDVFTLLDSGEAGLSSEEVARRAARDGPNRFADHPPRRLVRRLVSNFVHLMAVLLWIGGGVAFVAGLPQLGVAIWVVNLVNGLFAFWQEFRAEKATAALRLLLPTFATALRDGVPSRLQAEELVVGDVLLLGEGDRISADARLVEDAGLRVDQSTMSGESRPARKASSACEADGVNPAEIPNMVYAGTTVVAGRGRGVVTAIGSGTQLGRVASMTQRIEPEPSPLQLEMRRLSIVVSFVAVGVGVVFLLVALALGLMSPTRSFVFALGMIVAFVPEGLLPTVTLSLAMGTQRMAKRNALVKKLSAVETLGSTTVICTDKTGTLTQNEMTVLVAIAAGVQHSFSGVGYRPDGSVEPPSTSHLISLLESAVAASNARTHPDETGRWMGVGDPTEAAIVTAAAKAGVHTGRWARVVELPFDSTRRRMSTVDSDGRVFEVHTKGSADGLLTVSSTISTADGAVPLTEAAAAEVRADIDRLSGMGLRVLGVCRRAFATSPASDLDPGDVEVELEFLGLIAMQDPPRPEVRDAVATCTRAGIRIVMITGDYGLTAVSIGRRIGMISETAVIVNGEELDRLPDEELADLLDTEVLFARATPEHKLRVVEALRSLGHVVAVTGDGVNDAPALKRADIGIAMGLSGTDVAKEAADMILLDDNFASIVAAVEEGRAVFANIKRFTTYILTSNTPEAVPFVVFALSGGVIPIALDVMHILAIDLGTDLAPALALGAEPAESGVMDRPPRRADEHVIDRPLLTTAYLWLGPAQAAFVMAAFFGAFRLAGITDWTELPGSGPVYRSATAMALAAVVFTQIGNLFAQRARTGSWYGGNRLVWWGIASELAVVAAIVFVPWLGAIVGTAPFPAVGWAWLLTGIPLLPAIVFVRRHVNRRSERKA